MLRAEVIRIEVQLFGFDFDEPRSRIPRTS